MVFIYAAYEICDLTVQVGTFSYFVISLKTSRGTCIEFSSILTKEQKFYI